MPVKYLLVAQNDEVAGEFAALNHIEESDYLIASEPGKLTGISNLQAVFIDGWKEREDHFAIIQGINEAEIRGVTLLMDVKANEVINLEMEKGHDID